MRLDYTTKERGINGLTIVFAILALAIYSCPAQAQGFKSIKYIGLEGAIGTRSFTIVSNIQEIDQMVALNEGGSLGIVVGNEYFRTKIRAAGFYFSASRVPQTIELFESEGVINFYPLQYFRKHRQAFDIYVLGGASLDNVKFYGHYLDSDRQKINHSDSREKYIGRVSQWNISGGFGIEYQLPYKRDFVHIFAEAKTGTPVKVNSADKVFNKTSTSNFSSITIGVNFGIHR